MHCLQSSGNNNREQRIPYFVTCNSSQYIFFWERVLVGDLLSIDDMFSVNLAAEMIFHFYHMIINLISSRILLLEVSCKYEVMSFCMVLLLCI